MGINKLIVLTAIFVLLTLPVLPADATLKGWQVRDKVINGTGIQPSGWTTATNACVKMQTAGFNMSVPTDGNDTIYLWNKGDYPLVFAKGTAKTWADVNQSRIIDIPAQLFERGGMCPLKRVGGIVGYAVLTADAGVIILDVHGNPTQMV